MAEAAAECAGFHTSILSDKSMAPAEIGNKATVPGRIIGVFLNGDKIEPSNKSRRTNA